MNTSQNILETRKQLLRDLRTAGAPRALRPVMDAFAEIHATYEAASVRTERARLACAKSGKAVTDARATLAEGVEALAVALVGARVSTRRSPFQPFGRSGPGRLLLGAPAGVVSRVLRLTDDVVAADLSPEVTRSARACRKLAEDLDAANERAKAMAIARDDALTAREALRPEWDTATRRLTLSARAAWLDDPRKLQHVLAVGRTRKRKVESEASALANAVAAAPAPPTVTPPDPTG